MRMFWEFVNWTVISQGLLLIFWKFFKAETYAIYAIWLFSHAYFSCLLASFILVGYYSKYIFINIMGREIGSREKQMDKKYKAENNLK